MPYKEFANGSPLPASDIDTYLMDQAVMTFANSTARSTAIPSPKEGMLTYLEDTNQLSLWTGSAWVVQNPMTSTGDLIVGGTGGAPTRLAIGSNGSIPLVSSGTLGYLPIGANGTVLTSNGTTAAWGTIAGGGFTLISTTTLSGATVNLTSLPQTYKQLYFVVRNLRVNTSGSNVTITVNSTTIRQKYLNRSNTWSDTTAGEFWNASSFLNNQDHSFVFTIDDYTASTGRKPIRAWGYWFDNGTSEINAINATGVTTSTSAITSVTFTCSSSFVSGSILTYGVN